MDYKVEASLVGLIWIKKLDKDYSQYVFPCGCEGKLQMSGVRRKKDSYKYCARCKKEKLEQEYETQALEVGLKLACKTKNRRTRLYVFPCGHKEEKTVTQVKTDQARCNQCVIEKYIRLGRKQGLVPIEHISGGDYWLWEFIGCGHRREIQPSNVINGDVVCKKCINKKHNYEAQKNGLELLGNADDLLYDSNFRKYRINACGHNKIISIDSVRKGNWRCGVCLKNKLSHEANSKNLELICDIGRASYRLYEFKDCGHRQIISSVQIRHSKYMTCRRCSVSSWTKPNFLYLFKIKVGAFSWLKLGHSAHLRNRVNQYGLPEGFSYELLASHEFNTRLEALRAEKSLHSIFFGQRLNKNLMKKYHTRSGASECYWVDTEGRILKYFEDLFMP